MLPIGHILTATLYTKIAAPRLKLDFVRMLTVVILMNMIDLDHLINYAQDDGTANSLTLHPGHIYSSVIIFGLILFSLFQKRYKAVVYMIAGGLSLHMAADALAYAFGYSLTALVVMDAILGIMLILYRNKLDTTVPGNRLILFLTAITILSASSQYYLAFILKLDPTKEIIMYVVPNLIFLLAGIGSFLVFKKYKNNVGGNTLTI